MKQVRLLGLLAMAVWAVGGCSDEDVADIPPVDAPLVQQLTNNDVFEANPVFSPDGQWIVYESDAAGNRDIWMLPAAGGDPVHVTSDPGFDSSPAWLPDGSGIVFESDRSGVKSIWRMDPEDLAAEPVQLTPDDGDDGSPAVSSDGAWIVFESNRDKGWGQDLWYVAVAGGAVQRLTDTADGIYNRTADWAPTSDAVVYESNVSGWSALHVSALAGGESRQITPDTGYEGHPAWSPDGEWVAFESTRSGTMQIHLVAAGGGSLQKLTIEGGYWPQWSPDGSSIVFGVDGDSHQDIWLLEMN